MKAISTLKKSDEKTTIIFSEKETLIREIIFSLFSTEINLKTVISEIMHREIEKRVIQKILFNQTIKKVSEVDKLNFRALCLLWNWNSSWIVVLIRQCFCLEIHFQIWKTVKKILLQKSNKSDNILVKIYRVVSLLNCLNKVIEKIAAEIITCHCKTKKTLHQD